MPDRPDAHALLAVAQAELAALFGQLDARHDYTLRMAASAIGIAARELAARDGAEGAVAARADDLDDRSLMRRVEACAEDDLETQRALHAELVVATRRKLAITFPQRVEALLPGAPRGDASLAPVRDDDPQAPAGDRDAATSPGVKARA